MASSKPVKEAPGVVGYNADDYEWDTVHEEAPDQLVFDTQGDTYVGAYNGHEIIHAPTKDNDDNWFIQLAWRDGEGLKVTNAGYELASTYVDIDYDNMVEFKTRDGRVILVPMTTDKIAPGTMTRNVLKKFVDVGQASPMKSFQVDTARARNTR